MKKSLIALVAFVVITLAWTSLYEGKVVPASAPVATSTPVVATSSAVATTTPIDYSKLEKDSIYTEEEGKYENLPLEGKTILEKLIGQHGCSADSIDNINCYNNGAMIKAGAILSFKEGIMLYRAPTGKGGYYFMIYDTKKESHTGKQVFSVNLGIRNKNIVVFANTADLLYYKPGASDFKKVPNSTLQKYPKEYYVGDALGSTAIGKITEGMLTVSVFTYDQNVMNKKVREASFNLTTFQ